MIRAAIDVPLIFARVLNVDWRPDWRGSPAAQGTDGSEQMVLNRLPRFVGSPSIVLPTDMIGHWRAIITRGQGRVNAYRIRMVDPAVQPFAFGGGWQSDWRAYQAGVYQEPRPQVTVVSATAAGSTSITVDETLAPRPIPVGAYLSHNDWPFIVTGRSGSGPAVVLQVDMLRRAIPAGAKIDLIARGLFLGASDAMGFPDYGLDRVARPQLDLVEWITR